MAFDIAGTLGLNVTRLLTNNTHKSADTSDQLALGNITAHRPLHAVLAEINILSFLYSFNPMNYYLNNTIIQRLMLAYSQYWILNLNERFVGIFYLHFWLLSNSHILCYLIGVSIFMTHVTTFIILR